MRQPAEAQHPLDMTSSRVWKVINPSVKNALAQPVEYALIRLAGRRHQGQVANGTIDLSVVMLSDMYMEATRPIIPY